MLKNNLNFTSLFVVLVLFGMTSCSPQRMMETGNYDDALHYALDKVRGKKNKKQKHVLTIEEAFQRANGRDMAAINRLRAEHNPANWSRIYDLAQRIAHRQSRVEPLLPLTDKDGLQAGFQFVKTERILQEAKKEAAEHLYAKASRLLDDARLGDKEAARSAYSVLNSIDKYYNNYRQQERMTKEALALGTVHVMFKVKNNARVILPRDFERELLRMSVGELDSRWKKFHTRSQNGLALDYEIVMNITDIDVSPSRVREREFEESKQIEDGFEYARDKKGNVKVDTLGKPIRFPRKIQVNAWVLETLQNKAALVEGRLEYYDTRNRRLIDSKPMAAEAIFEHVAATFQGDKRALDPNTCRIIDNRPQPFPSDAALLFDAAEQLRPVIRQHIASTRFVG